MGRPLFLALLAVSGILLLLSMPQGEEGRKIHVMRHYNRWEESPETLQQVDSGMVAVDMDYKEPRANADTRNGGIFDDSSSSSSPGPSPLFH